MLFDEDHHHDHEYDHEDDHHGHDTNIRAAYLHVLADALTSIFAIIALLAGRFFDWVWLDPVIGIVGAIVIAHWSWGLLRSAGAVLLDMVPNPRLAATLRERLEVGRDRVSDLHLWRLGPGHTGVTASIVSHDPLHPAAYKERPPGATSGGCVSGAS
jgi:cation diffusion facilitator family transporter